MKKILVLNNNLDPPYDGATDIVHCLERAIPKFGKAEILCKHIPGGEHLGNASDYDAVCISGSRARALDQDKWIQDEILFIQELHKKKVPTFGICYGEQLIARAIAGEEYVGPSKIYEYGWGAMDLLAAAKKSKVFFNLPDHFYSLCFHQDEVKSTLPKDRFLIVAKSMDCPVQAYDVLDAPMWAVQFHPERLMEKGVETLSKWMKNNPQKKALTCDNPEKVYDAKIAERIFENFLSLVWAR